MFCLIRGVLAPLKLYVENSVEKTIAFLKRIGALNKLKELKTRIEQLPVSKTHPACVDSSFEISSANGTWIVGLILYAFEVGKFHTEMCRIKCKAVVEKAAATKEIARFLGWHRKGLHLPPKDPIYKMEAMKIIALLIQGDTGLDIFRGQPRVDLPLLPKAMRKEFQKGDHLEALARFRRECPASGLVLNNRL